MVSLIELVRTYGGLTTDLQIIKMFFIKNGIEADGIELMRNLAVEKVHRLELENQKIKGNISMYYPTHTNSTWSVELQSATERAMLFQMSGQEIPDNILAYLAKEIPKVKCPSLFWRDLYEYLKAKGIYFKGDKEKSNENK